MWPSNIMVAILMEKTCAVLYKYEFPQSDLPTSTHPQKKNGSTHFLQLHIHCLALFSGNGNGGTAVRHTFICTALVVPSSKSMHASDEHILILIMTTFKS
ncbi:hypothetical protein IscW_ISCW008406 [Ixodes scapularis]|uniref:Uncharacterized protein n=1 Tax=Ixodes scapularis TaxID=6945 RepID=B7PWH3_IXOSC|nr:hypothetical protein IscW_ISCW008406 [Ixodes scapularis]|eukprot:XP_002409879.1 hypothetical protein IscW_ISCW008406 [Ixodes scapularis]